MPAFNPSTDELMRIIIDLVGHGNVHQVPWKGIMTEAAELIEQYRKTKKPAAG